MVFNAGPLHFYLNALTDIFKTWSFLFSPLCKNFLGFDLPKTPRAATCLALAEVVSAAWLEMRQIAVPILVKLGGVEASSLLYLLELSLPSSYLAYCILCRNNRGAAYLEYLHFLAYEMMMRGRRNYRLWTFETVANMLHLRDNQRDVYDFVMQHLPSVDENFGEVSNERALVCSEGAWRLCPTSHHTPNTPDAQAGIHSTFERFMKPYETGEQAKRRLLQQAASNQNHAGMNLEGVLGTGTRSFRKRQKQADLDNGSTFVIEYLSALIERISKSSPTIIPATKEGKPATKVICPSFDTERVFRIQKIASPAYAWAASLSSADGLSPHTVAAHPQNGCQAYGCSKSTGISSFRLCGHRLCNNCWTPGTHCPLCAAMAGKVMNSVMIRRVKKYDNDFITPDRIHEQALRSEGEGGDEDDSRGDGGDEEEEEEVAEEGEDEEEEDEVVVIDEEDEPTETQGRLSEDLKKRREKALGCLKRIFQVL